MSEEKLNEIKEIMGTVNTKPVMKELVLIQSELKAPKNQFNKFGNYKYRSCEDIIEGVKPLLKKYNCYLSISDNIINIGNRYYIQAVSEITNSIGMSVSTTAYAREPENQKGMNEAQITGSASSYARKYSLNGLLAIDDTKDADNNQPTNNQEREKIINLIMANYNNTSKPSSELKKWVDSINVHTIEQLKSGLKKLQGEK